MDKSPIFNVIEKVLNRVDDEEADVEQGWIDHYIQLADRLLKRRPLGFDSSRRTAEKDSSEDAHSKRNGASKKAA